MPVNPTFSTSTVRKMVSSAFDVAKAEWRALQKGKMTENQAKSRAIVQYVCDAICEHYSGAQCWRGFCKGDTRNTDVLPTTELLHDITVCRTQQLLRSDERRKNPVHSVVEVAWQVESELGSSYEDMLHDMSKLVCGAARYKLFIRSARHDGTLDPDGILALAASAFSYNLKQCDVYIAAVPHPDHWNDGRYQADAWKLKDGRWRS